MNDARKPLGTIKERVIFSHLLALEFLVATPLITMKITKGNISTQSGMRRMKMLVSIVPSNFMHRATRKP